MRLRRWFSLEFTSKEGERKMCDVAREPNTWHGPCLPAYNLLH